RTTPRSCQTHAGDHRARGHSRSRHHLLRADCRTKQSKRMRETFVAVTYAALLLQQIGSIFSLAASETEIKLNVLLITTMPVRGVLILLAEFGARGHVEILSSNTAGASGIEVEGCAVARQCRTSLRSRRVDRGTQVHRRRPRIARTCPRRDPDVQRRLT